METIILNIILRAQDFQKQKNSLLKSHEEFKSPN
jgi:hypothetical protein